MGLWGCIEVKEISVPKNAMGRIGTQMASLESQSRQGVLNLTMAPRIGGDLEEGF